MTYEHGFIHKNLGILLYLLFDILIFGKSDIILKVHVQIIV